MTDALIMVALGVLQIFGATYAFQVDGVLAKMVGLLFCISTVACFSAAGIFAKHDGKKKGE